MNQTYNASVGGFQNTPFNQNPPWIPKDLEANLSLDESNFACDRLYRGFEGLWSYKVSVF